MNAFNVFRRSHSIFLGPRYHQFWYFVISEGFFLPSCFKIFDKFLIALFPLQYYRKTCLLARIKFQKFHQCSHSSDPKQQFNTVNRFHHTSWNQFMTNFLNIFYDSWCFFVCPIFPSLLSFFPHAAILHYTKNIEYLLVLLHLFYSHVSSDDCISIF